MSSTNPEHNLTPDEIENLNRLEAVAQDGVESYVQVSNALSEIRDRHLYRNSHPSFEAYVRERWGINRQLRTPVPNKPCEALARACEETLSTLSDEDRTAIEVRLAVRKPGDPDAVADGQRWDPWEVADAMGDELLPTLRWLLTQASGTIGRVAHQLEHRAADIDDDARDQLLDDVLVVDDELAAVKALLLTLVDWDSELARLLEDEVPPFERDPEDDE